VSADAVQTPGNKRKYTFLVADAPPPGTVGPGPWLNRTVGLPAPRAPPYREPQRGRAHGVADPTVSHSRWGPPRPRPLLQGGLGPHPACHQASIEESNPFGLGLTGSPKGFTNTAVL
jgi:hypothetical protein